MVWTIDLDDFNNICCRGSYPLLTKVNEVFKRIPIKAPNSVCNKPDYPATPANQIPTATEEGQGCLYSKLKCILIIILFAIIIIIFTAYRYNVYYVIE